MCDKSVNDSEMEIVSPSNGENGCETSYPLKAEYAPKFVKNVCQKRKGCSPVTEVKHVKKDPEETSEDNESSLPEYDDDEAPQYVTFSQDSCDKPCTNSLFDTLIPKNPFNEVQRCFETTQEIYTVPAVNDGSSSNFCSTEFNSFNQKYCQYPSDYTLPPQCNSPSSYQNTSDCFNYRVAHIASDSFHHNLPSTGLWPGNPHLKDPHSFPAKEFKLQQHISLNDRTVCHQDTQPRKCVMNSSTVKPLFRTYFPNPLQSHVNEYTKEFYLKPQATNTQSLGSLSENNSHISITAESLIQNEVESDQLLGISLFEPPNKNSCHNEKLLTKQPEESISAVQTQLSLYPSTYIEKSYYKNDLPHEYIERNKFYSNRSKSNSLDNLSEVDSSISCESTPKSSPLKPRHQRLSFPLTKKPDSSRFSYFTPQNNYRTSALTYSLDKLYNSELTEKIIDTHCHLDFLFQKENHKGTFGAYKDRNENEFLTCFGGCVANFIEPAFFMKQSNWENLLKEDNVWASFGVHPHFSNRYDEIIEDVLTEALKHDKVVAIGEIGLDYSGKNNCDKTLQQQVFKRQLEIAVKSKKPLIIHCRDAQEDCLRILSENVPRETKIHRHCFTGNWIEAQEWLGKFPNLFLGFTSLVTFRSVRHLHQVARLTPVERLLFETDAPYFVPSQITNCMSSKGNQERKFSHPGMVVHVAAQIATIKGVKDFPAFLATVRENTRRMYNI